jgi:hypothetical protein
LGPHVVSYELYDALTGLRPPNGFPSHHDFVAQRFAGPRVHPPLPRRSPGRKVERHEIREENALRIGRQIMRDNALELFPSLTNKLWKHKGVKMTPPPP